MMSFRSLLLLTITLLVYSSCGPCEGCENMAAREQALDEREQELAEREAKLQEQIAVLEKSAVPEAEAEAPEQEANMEGTSVEADHPIRIGTHNITLQWISWDHPGTAEVTFINKDRYQIVGEQRSRENDDYLIIDGSLVPQDERTFLFEGAIEYRVSHNNGGEPCIKTGPLHFKASGKRKYWRLQEKINCEGGMLTDYIDIYF